MDINTDPVCVRTMDPDIVLINNQGLDVTLAQVTQISMAPVTVLPINMQIGPRCWFKPLILACLLIISSQTLTTVGPLIKTWPKATAWARTSPWYFVAIQGTRTFKVSAAAWPSHPHLASGEGPDCGYLHCLWCYQETRMSNLTLVTDEPQTQTWFYSTTLAQLSPWSQVTAQFL